VVAGTHPRVGLAAGNTGFMVEPMSDSVCGVFLPRLVHLLGEGKGFRSGFAREA
jgi:hypothetical protein